MDGRRVTVIAVMATLATMGLVPSPTVATHQSASGKYVTGGSIEGAVFVQCVDIAGYDVGGVCKLPCPTSKCRVTVVDAYQGSNIWFRVCIYGETFCRPQGYHGTGTVSVTPGSLITVALQLQEATTGTATVTGLH